MKIVIVTVSILVLMDVGLKRLLCILLFHCKTPVSILVLMDVGLKRGQYAGTYLMVVCFNPCFDGCWS